MEDDFVDAEIINVQLIGDVLSKIQWKTKDEGWVYIKDMNDRHLRNSALFLMNMGYLKCIAPEPVRIKWLIVFRMEWERRLRARENGIFRCPPDDDRRLTH